MLSYWEKQHFTDFHYLVIGGGLVGLSTALSLRDLHPRATIGVLEKGIFPSGASTKNAGFACFGSVTELLADIDAMGSEACVQLVEQRWQGLDLLRKRVGDEILNFQNCGGYELLTEEDLPSLEKLEYLNELLYPVFQQKVFIEKSAKISSFGFNDDKVKALVENPLEGMLDPGAMMAALWSLARSSGIQVITGAQVDHFQESEAGMEVEVRSEPYAVTLRCQRLAVCTNAFSSDLLGALDLKPGRGIALITKPVEDLKIKGVFHYQQGFYYFRNVGSRLLLGGGRNTDLQTETTTDFKINHKILDHLQEQIREVIMPGQSFEIDQTWAGIMAFGPNKKPLVGLHSSQVGYAIRLGGMGVALGSLLGYQLAQLLCLNPQNA